MAFDLLNASAKSWYMEGKHFKTASSGCSRILRRVSGWIVDRQSEKQFSPQLTIWPEVHCRSGSCLRSHGNPRMTGV